MNNSTHKEEDARREMLANSLMMRLYAARDDAEGLQATTPDNADDEDLAYLIELLQIGVPLAERIKGRNHGQASFTDMLNVMTRRAGRG